MAMYTECSKPTIPCPEEALSPHGVLGLWKGGHASEVPGELMENHPPTGFNILFPSFVWFRCCLRCKPISKQS